MTQSATFDWHSPFAYLLQEHKKRWSLLGQLRNGKPHLLLAEENGLMIFSGSTPMVESRCIDSDPDGVPVYYPIREPNIENLIDENGVARVAGFIELLVQGVPDYFDVKEDFFPYAILMRGPSMLLQGLPKVNTDEGLPVVDFSGWSPSFNDAPGKIYVPASVFALPMLEIRLQEISRLDMLLCLPYHRAGDFVSDDLTQV